MRSLPIALSLLVALAAAPSEAQEPARSAWMPAEPMKVEAGAGTPGDITTGSSGPDQEAAEEAGGTGADTTEAGQTGGAGEGPPDLLALCDDLQDAPEIHQVCVEKIQE